MYYSVFDIERLNFFTDDVGHDIGLCMGIDFGKTCWVTVGCVNPDESVHWYIKHLLMSMI